MLEREEKYAMHQADVYLFDRLAGRLTEDENGYIYWKAQHDRKKTKA